MIGDLDERFEIHKATTEKTSGGKSETFSKQSTVWGKEVRADSRVRQQFDSLDSTITYVLKLAGTPDLAYDNYKLKRVGDDKWYIPETPPTESGQHQTMTFVGVRVEEN